VHVAIAIVSYGSAQDIAHCLKALSGSTYRDFDVIICENGGPGAFDALCAVVPASLPGGQAVRAVLADRNLGYAGGVNLCLRETQGADAWWVLNPDTFPSAEALGAMVVRLRRGDCQAVGSTVHHKAGVVQSHGGRWRKPFARAVSIGHGQLLASKPDPTAIETLQNYLNGASMLVSRAFVEATGPMAEDYFLYCEEVEWCLRAEARGMRLGFAPDAPILHAQGTSTGNSVDLKTRSQLSVYLNERNRLLLTRDLYPGLLPVAAVAALAILTLRFVRAQAWRQWRYALSGWFAGVFNQRGVPTHLMSGAS
jgi:N-acetylglucosaminyl-diphospho-decaprenol L-rhamnosyltransferase